MKYLFIGGELDGKEIDVADGQEFVVGESDDEQRRSEYRKHSLGDPGNDLTFFVDTGTKLEHALDRLLKYYSKSD